ncbi:hypothetical protein SUGI_0412730 [Cryptomeria japonica]|nr:hypothetical protein SUGI_0412730 [Cryptomeria japonica]
MHSKKCGQFLKKIFVQRVWDMITMEQLCKACKYVVRTCGKSMVIIMGNMLQEVQMQYTVHHQSCFLYLASEVIKVFGSDPSCANYLGGLITELFGQTVGLLKTIQEFTSRPDIADDCFLLSSRCIRYCPHLLISSSVFASLIECAMIGVTIQHRMEALESHSQTTGFCLTTIYWQTKKLVDGHFDFFFGEEVAFGVALLMGLYSEMGFEKPSKVQAVTLPIIIIPPHQNLIAQAHNGFGRTTCFVLGMLSIVNLNIDAPQALCVCPTRELAIQNQEVLLKMAKHTSITPTCVVPTDVASYVKRCGNMQESNRIKSLLSMLSHSNCPNPIFRASG